MMSTILASAQPFGFGPVAKLVSLVEHLRDRVQVSVAGEGNTLRYARLNGRRVATFIPFDFAQRAAARQLMRCFDAAISVMEPRLVYTAVREQRPVYFFDSLFPFWIASRPLPELADIARHLVSALDAAGEALFDSLSVHESMLVSHMIASRSYAQVFPGVTDRIAHFAALGFHQIEAAGPMIGVHGLDRQPQAAGDSRTLLVNLGGFNNAFLDYERHGAYVDIVVRWLARLAAKTTTFTEIVVCSGAFAQPSTHRINGVTLWTGLLCHADLLARIAAGAVYLISPGLTSLQEAVALSVLPMLLPDQHYGHTINRRRLATTAFALTGAAFPKEAQSRPVPEDDLEGTLIIAETAARIHNDAARFAVFADHMDERLASFMSVTPEQRREQLIEIRALFHGTPMGPLVAKIEEEVSARAQ